MSDKRSVKEKAEALGRPIAERLGLSLWDTEFVKEGASWFLRFYIDKPDGVMMDDCEAFSKEIDPLLDEEDFIDEAYYLEVSSPGIERKLNKPEHFEFCIGEPVKLRFIRPVDGSKELTGTLTAFEDGVITVENGGESRTVQFKDCAWVKLFDDTDYQDI